MAFLENRRCSLFYFRRGISLTGKKFYEEWNKGYASARATRNERKIPKRRSQTVHREILRDVRRLEKIITFVPIGEGGGGGGGNEYCHSSTSFKYFDILYIEWLLHRIVILFPLLSFFPFLLILFSLTVAIRNKLSHENSFSFFAVNFNVTSSLEIIIILVVYWSLACPRCY